MCEKCFEEYQLNQYDDLDYYESDYSEEDKMCEWNKDSIHRDYCYNLKESNKLYCLNHIEEDIDIYFGLEYIKYMLYIEKKIEDDMYLDFISYIINIESNFINQKNIEIKVYNKSIIDIEKEIEILNNINIYISDKYYINKYEIFDMKETIKDNMGLCYENNCYNIIKQNEDLCHKHWYEQNIDDYDENGITIVFKGYNKYKSKEDYLGEPNFHKRMIKFKYKGIKYNY